MPLEQPNVLNHQIYEFDGVPYCEPCALRLELIDAHEASRFKIEKPGIPCSECIAFRGGWHPEIRHKVIVDYLNAIADQLDRWAEASRSGGWSTHQVQPMIDKANDIRRFASQVKV